jgi:hypothetical protein
MVGQIGTGLFRVQCGYDSFLVSSLDIEVGRRKCPRRNLPKTDGRKLIADSYFLLFSPSLYMYLIAGL